MPNPDLCSELSPPVPPACAKVTWKPSQTGGESLCACGIKQKSKQIAKQEGTYSPGLKIFNLRTCREACPTATDAQGPSTPLGQALTEGADGVLLALWCILQIQWKEWKLLMLQRLGTCRCVWAVSSRCPAGGTQSRQGGLGWWRQLLLRARLPPHTPLPQRGFVVKVTGFVFALFSSLQANNPESGKQAGKISMLSEQCKHQFKSTKLQWAI